MCFGIQPFVSLVTHCMSWVSSQAENFATDKESDEIRVCFHLVKLKKSQWESVNY